MPFYKNRIKIYRIPFTDTILICKGFKVKEKEITGEGIKYEITETYYRQNLTEEHNENKKVLNEYYIEAGRK